MDAQALIEAIAMAMTCVLVLVGWHAVAALRVAEDALQDEPEDRLAATS